MSGAAPVFAAEGGSSWLHRLDPLVKLSWLLAVIVVAFATDHPAPLFAIALAGLAIAVSAGVGWRVVRILAIFIPITSSILVIQTIAPPVCAGGGCIPVATVGPFELYQEGTIRGLSLVGRLVAVESVALAVILTTHPSDLFAALARVRVPYVVNLMLSMTLQLIPILQREFEIVLSAQRARGMRGSGFRALLPSFVPVFAGARERLAALAGIAAGVLGVLAALTVWSADQLTDVVVPVPVVVGLFLVAATLFGGVLAVGIRSIVRA